MLLCINLARFLFFLLLFLIQVLRLSMNFLEFALCASGQCMTKPQHYGTMHALGCYGHRICHTEYHPTDYKIHSLLFFIFSFIRTYVSYMFFHFFLSMYMLLLDYEKLCYRVSRLKGKTRFNNFSSSFQLALLTNNHYFYHSRLSVLFFVSFTNKFLTTT